MSKNNRIPLTNMKNINQKYLSKRKEIIKIIRATSAKLNFNSQTFFYSIYYLDIIFSKENTIQKLSDFVLISLNCLVIAAKFNENEPTVPETKKFGSVLSNLTRFRYRYSLNDMAQAEIFCLKMLNYKLNYYSLYHFLVFFFAHGIFFNNFQNDSLNYMKILEKIYITSREILDYVIEEEFFFIGDDCVLTAVIILRKSMEFFVKNFHVFDVFKEIYYIDEKKERYIKINKVITSIYENKIGKKEVPKSNLKNSILSTNSEKISEKAKNFSKELITNFKKDKIVLKKRAHSFYFLPEPPFFFRKRAYSSGNKIEKSIKVKSSSKDQINLSQASSNASDHSKGGTQKK